MNVSFSLQNSEFLLDVCGFAFCHLLGLVWEL